jgi:hypothetical protein
VSNTEAWIVIGFFSFCLIFILILPYLPDPDNNWENEMDREMDDYFE